ncbi:hypothetical protein FACS189459_4060 [Bacilli bacterium]|nr:hypothetical protein FACS189459_4060 [Bacilli bacterium]
MSNFLQPYKNQGQFLINSDSQELVNNYSQDNLSQGIISYNGDIGYAGVGAGDNNSFNETLKK